MSSWTMLSVSGGLTWRSLYRAWTPFTKERTTSTAWGSGSSGYFDSMNFRKSASREE
jgi:hypothetical protein